MLKLRFAAAHLGVSQSSLRRWIKAGHIKAIKIGRQWFVSEDEVRHILKRGLVYPGTTPKNDKLGA